MQMFLLYLKLYSFFPRRKLIPKKDSGMLLRNIALNSAAVMIIETSIDYILEPKPMLYLHSKQPSQNFKKIPIYKILSARNIKKNRWQKVD